MSLLLSTGLFLVMTIKSKLPHVGNEPHRVGMLPKSLLPL